MRRLHDRRPTTLFRGGELPRLMTMIVMLGVIVMLMSRAKDVSMWRALVGNAADEDSPTIHAEDLRGGKPVQPVVKLPEPASKEPTVEVAPPGSPKPEEEHSEPPAADNSEADDPAPDNSSPDVPGADVPPPESQAAEAPAATVSHDSSEDIPNDLDPAEQADAKRDFETVFDKDKLSAIDMPAYWRLYRWAKSQTPQALRARGRKDLLFTHLWERPEQYRGQLIRLHRLHLRRILSYELTDIPNHADVERLYEGWGFTDESKPNPYVIVFPDLPKGMPLGPDLHEEVSFAGYFLKIMPYVAKDEKERGVPLLIGRVIWHPGVPAAPPPKIAEWQWGLIFGGGAVVLLLALQWIPHRLKRGDKVKRAPREGMNSLEEDAVPIEDWLEQAETPETLEIADGHGSNGTPGINGNGSAGLLGDRLDGSKDRDG